MADKWVVDAEYPQGHLVPLTPEEEAQLAADRDVWAADKTVRDAEDANEKAIRQDIASRLQTMRDLAAKVEANTATAAEQRQLLALVARGEIRLARLALNMLDATG